MYLVVHTYDFVSPYSSAHDSSQHISEINNSLDFKIRNKSSYVKGIMLFICGLTFCNELIIPLWSTTPQYFVLAKCHCFSIFFKGWYKYITWLIYSHCTSFYCSWGHMAMCSHLVLFYITGNWIPITDSWLHVVCICWCFGCWCYCWDRD